MNKKKIHLNINEISHCVRTSLIYKCFNHSLSALASSLQPQERMAAVRPLHIPEPPPLISSAKPGGSITQVRAALNLSQYQCSFDVVLLGPIINIMYSTFKVF